jgi:hypothetical protein
MPEPSGSSGSRIWRGAAPRPTAQPQPPSGKRGKVLGLSAAILALVGALVAWIFYPSPVRNPYFLAIVISEYRDPGIPINAWANQDRQALLAFPWRDNNAFTSQQRNLLVQELRNLETGRKPDEPVVVYLSAIARTGPDGKVALLPGDGRLDEPASWLPMDEVLKSIRLCPARHKLLILDVMHPFQEPSDGILPSDVAERLQPDLQSAVEADDHLQILCACSPGQAALFSEELAHSVFGHYLLQGLRGRADGYNPQHTRDGRVSVRELAEYVASHVDRWAWLTRQTRQTPMLLGSGSDFHLLVCESQPAASEETGLDAAYPDWLRSRWKLRDGWWNDESFRVARRPYRELEAALLAAERQYRAGIDPRRIQDDLAVRVNRLQQQRNERVAALERPEAVSLAAVIAQGRKTPDLAGTDTLQQLKDLTDLNARLQVAKPDEKDKARLATEREQFLKKFKDDPFALAWTVFALALAENQPRPDQLRFWSDLLRQSPGQPVYVETRFLHQLATTKTENGRNWPAEAVHTALQVVAEAAKAQAGDARSLPWVRQLREQAARKRREAEPSLFAPEPAARDRARQLLTEAFRDYQAVNQYLAIIQQAQRCRDEAFVLLPGYAPYLQFDPFDTTGEKAWQDAVTTAQRLQTVLADPDDPSPLAERISKMGDLTEALRNNLKGLQHPVEADKLKRLINQSGRPNPSDWLEMSALLETPILSAGQRVAVWNGQRGLAGRLQTEAMSQGGSDEPQQFLRNALPSFDLEKARSQETRRVLLRARCSIALLRLEGGPTDKRLEAALAQVSRSPTPATWASLNQALRQAWTRHTAGPQSQ